MAKLPPAPMQRVPAERVEFRGLVDRLIADLQEAGKLREERLAAERERQEADR
jgi:hypothetical protein